MTSSESQPRTPPSPGTVRWTFKPGTVRLIEHDGFTEVLFPEAEAAQDSRLDVDSLLRRIRMVLGMIEPAEREEYGEPGRRTWMMVDDAWSDLLALHNDVEARLAAEKPHD